VPAAIFQAMDHGSDMAALVFQVQWCAGKAIGRHEDLNTYHLLQAP
jgi:hypothetical protein